MGAAQGIGNQLGAGGMPPYGIYVTQQPVQQLPMHQVSISFLSVLLAFLIRYLIIVRKIVVVAAAAKEFQ